MVACFENAETYLNRLRAVPSAAVVAFGWTAIATAAGTGIFAQGATDLLAFFGPIMTGEGLTRPAGGQ